MVAMGEQYRARLRAQGWCSKQMNFDDDERDPYAVFNVLDTMLKDNLERLKMMRSAFDFCTH
jgi:hypothetical protein